MQSERYLLFPYNSWIWIVCEKRSEDHRAGTQEEDDLSTVDNKEPTASQPMKTKVMASVSTFTLCSLQLCNLVLILYMSICSIRFRRLFMTISFRVLHRYVNYLVKLLV